MSNWAKYERHYLNSLSSPKALPELVEGPFRFSQITCRARFDKLNDRHIQWRRLMG